MTRMELDPWLEGYLSYQRDLRRLGARTITDVRCTLKKIASDLATRHPSTPLWKLPLDAYLHWLNEMREQGRSERVLAKDLSHLRGLLDYAWRSGRADRNVLDGFSLQDSQRRVEPRSLTLEEASRLVQSSPRQTSEQRRARLIILLLYGCGFRTSELAGLDVQDVNVERQELFVKYGKGGRQRTIPVPAGVWTELLAYLAESQHKRGPLFRTATRKARIKDKDIGDVVRARGAVGDHHAAHAEAHLRHAPDGCGRRRRRHRLAHGPSLAHRDEHLPARLAREDARGRGHAQAGGVVMKWELWLSLFLERHCTARGLMPKTIAAYAATLKGFRAFVKFRLGDRDPDMLSASDILVYVDYLRRERGNGGSAVNRQVTVLKNLYRAIVAMGHLSPDRNPRAHFPTMKAVPTKLPVFLSEDEVRGLLAQPRTTTIIGLRDRALLTLLYGTGLRASEVATLREGDVDLHDNTVRVIGKGGHERVVPLNVEVARALQQYRAVRGRVTPMTPFFRSRSGASLGRGAIYERVRHHSAKARIVKRVSPHRLRHTFATHLVKRGVQLVTIRDLLGHASISSTQIYLHTTADDLRSAATKHPVESLVARIEDLLPNVRLPMQWLPGEKVVRRA